MRTATSRRSDNRHDRCMKYIKSIVLLLLLIWTIESNAQIKAGIGCSSAIYPNWNPGVPLTPYLFYQCHNHEIIVGLNLYSGQLGFASIIGAEMEYRNHFRHFSNGSTIFVQINFHYVRFGTGLAQSVPFNYSQFVAPGLNYSMIQMRTFNNTVGIGFQYRFLKICALNINAGIGYHFYRNTITEGVSASYVNSNDLGSGFTLGYTGKIGIAVDLIGKSKKAE